MAKQTAAFCLVLHAHLPYVHHPEYPYFFEESWLFEAISECYLPLISLLERLADERVPYRLTLSLSPTLLTMLRDPLLQQRYVAHLQRLIALAEQECQRTPAQPESVALAEAYRQRFIGLLERYQQHYQFDLLTPLLKQQQSGCLELMTTAATHGFLPLLNSSAAAVQTQVRCGLDCFEAVFGFRPQGFWLPECGFYPGLETVLAEAGVRYSIVDSHALTLASPAALNGVYAPVDCGSGVLAVARDPEASRQVWCAQTGYPAHPLYRDFYSDIGFERDLSELAPFLMDSDARVATGIKYRRITGKDQPKAWYQPEAALAQARADAADFVAQRQQQLQTLTVAMDRPPLLLAPFDAELFGHWWHEGMAWLETVLRLTAGSDAVPAATVSHAIAAQPPCQALMPVASSWGDQGYSAVWLNSSNDWIYPLLQRADAEMQRWVADVKDLALTPLQTRALNQALRSLLLAQASDWPFILRAGTTVDYAKLRVTDHLARFHYLHDAFRKNQLSADDVAALEIMDAVFATIDYRGYQAS